MNSFLSMVASDVIQHYGLNLSDVTFILPNRRSCNRFSLELVELIKQPIRTPVILSVNDWITSCSRFEQADDHEALLLLYDALKEAWPAAGSLPDFLTWGETLLRDFEEVDKYLADARILFRQLSDEKEIQTRFSVLDEEEITRILRFWKGFTEQSSSIQKEWLGLWNSLAQAHENYTVKLNARGLSVSGLMYREVARIANDTPAQLFTGAGICFIGFNALVGAEQEIFTQAGRSGIARFYWDAPELLPKYVKAFPSPSTFVNSFNSGSRRIFHPNRESFPEIEVLSFETGIGQTKFFGNRIDSGDNTLIVLGDESLLEEYLWSLQINQEEVNISIGYPVNKTRIGAGVVECLHTDRQQPFRSGDFLDELLKVAEGSSERNLSDSNYFERLASESLRERIYQLRGIGQSLSEADFLHFSHWAIGKWSETTNLPYLTNSKAKIQISGILETRVLDYEKIFILSFNEGIWPAKNRATTFIPYHLRKEFKLPVSDTLDQMYGYHFFRLIQRAKNINIGYLTLTEQSGTGNAEVSRLIRQLEFMYGEKVHHTTVVAPAGIQTSGSQSFDKDESVMNRLKRYTNLSNHPKVLSPSALNTYIDCPLKFFFVYILGLKDPDEKEDLAEPRLFGKLLHESVRYFYEQMLGSDQVTASGLQRFLKKPDFATEVILQFIRNDQNGPFLFLNPDHLKSKEKMVVQVIARYLRLILETDQAYAPFRLLAHEQEVKLWVPVDFEGTGTKVLLGGFIDRLDQKGSVIRIIDYKSGKPTSSIREYADLVDGKTKNRAKEVYQTLLYAWMLKSTGTYSDHSLIPGLYAMRNLEQGLINPALYVNRKELVDDLEYPAAIDVLTRELLGRLFDSTAGFEPTENIDSCYYCSFSSVCQRKTAY